MCANCRQLPRARLSRPSITQLAATFPVTSGIVALNVLVFVAMAAKGVSPANPTSSELLRWGANFGPLTYAGQSWRLLTSCFVHAGLLHIGFNMWAFWGLGLFVEKLLGHWRFLVAYLLAGLGGAIASVWWHPVSVSVGASGAIFGVAGILVALLRFGKVTGELEYLKAHSKSILTFIGYNLIFGFISPHVDNAAHLGGLATGVVIGTLLPRSDADDQSSSIRTAAIFGLIAFAMFLMFDYARRMNRGKTAAPQRAVALLVQNLSNDPVRSAAISSASRFSMSWRSRKYTSSPSRNSPIEGEEGG
jgi:rhomboid protease GluP